MEHKGKKLFSSCSVVSVGFWDGLLERYSRNINDFKQNTPSHTLKELFQTILYVKVSSQFPVLRGAFVEGAVILMENDKFFF